MDADRRWTRIAALLLIIELLSVAGDLFLGPWARTHWEELFNVRGGMMFACGHLDMFRELQYRGFCGGCTGEGVLSIPLFHALGPTVLVWKLIPLGFHLTIVALAVGLVGYGVGPRAAAAMAAVYVAAPGYYRDLTLTGWGNHAESEVFPLAAVAALALAAGRGAALRALLFAAAGVFVGLGMWFGHISAHALPAVGLMAVLAWRWGAPFLVVGVLIGMLPWWAYHGSREQVTSDTVHWWTKLQLSPPDRLLDFVFGDYMRDGLWAASDYGEPGWAPGVWWAALWVLAAVGVFRVLRRVRQGAAARAGATLYGPLALVGLLAAYVVRYDLWHNQPDIYADPTFNLRYRIPLVPTLGWCAALAVAWPIQQPVLRVFAMVLFAGLIGFGTAQRVSTWTELRTSAVGLRVYLHDGWADPTVPLGDPPKKNRRNQDRPQDVSVALAFLDDHVDPFPDCRMDHLHELGRRVGLGLIGSHADGVRPSLPGAVAAAQDDAQAWLLSVGVAKGLLAGDRERATEVGPQLAVIAEVDPGWADRVGRAVGRSAADALGPEGDETHRAALDPRVWQGLCEARGWQRVEIRSKLGRHRPTESPDSTVLGPRAGICDGTDAYWTGAGEAWARHVGCGDRDRALLIEESAERGAALVGFALGCARYRLP